MKLKSIAFDQSGVISIDSPKANVFIVLIGSLFIAALAQISIPIPYTPVPITGQTIGVILVGGLLGSKRGAFAVAAYLCEGSAGLPVFAELKAGFQVLAGPTAGYLWAFIPAAFFTGLMVEKGFTVKLLPSFLTCFTATTFILLFGSLYLTIFFNMSVGKAFTIGFYPFLIGDVLKSTACAGLLLTAKKFQ